MQCRYRRRVNVDADAECGWQYYKEVWKTHNRYGIEALKVTALVLSSPWLYLYWWHFHYQDSECETTGRKVFHLLWKNQLSVTSLISLDRFWKKLLSSSEYSSKIFLTNDAYIACLYAYIDKLLFTHRMTSKVDYQNSFPWIYFSNLLIQDESHQVFPLSHGFNSFWYKYKKSFNREKLLHFRSIFVLPKWGANPVLSKTSKMKRFGTIVNSF